MANRCYTWSIARGVTEMSAALQLTQKIREIEHFQSVPIVAVTAHASSQIKIEAMAIGMDDFIAKPFMPSDVLHTVRAHIK